VRTTLTHEIVHALQDQHFNIDHPEYDERDDEVSLTFSAVAEGDAIRIEEAYRNTMSERDRREETSQQRAAASGIDLRGVPPVLPQIVLFPYAVGPTLVSALSRAGGNARVDSAFRDPPTTTEQVMHPERFLAGEGPKQVAPPASDGTKFDEGVVGEFLLKLMLDSALNGDTAQAAAAGWGGDQYVAWDSGSKTCVRVAWTMDTTKDLDELRSAITRWADRQPDANVTGTDPLVMTTCA
jgi:hypothetical protein